MRRYTDRDIDLSRQIYQELVKNVRASKPEFVTYAEMGDAIGVFHRTIRGALYYIQDRCRDRDWPTLTVWVVRKSSGLPGLGCDVVEQEEVRRTAQQTLRVDWPAEPWW